MPCSVGISPSAMLSVRLVPLRSTVTGAILPGDVAATFADVEDLERDVGFKPATTIEDGVRKFVDWYLSFYGVAPLAGTT